ncbi:xylan glycosyltransferase MUCI21-like [Telopea speciosissima]|uniref:xylan glycosyltransferase MUCI21-like n=1 Tax=Telopea speciosissima TaxID=54955 RepID=UPI001CC53DD4|nr:xylan glycosyltransferase MUCI21-like [Telopea speciosissima]
MGKYLNIRVLFLFRARALSCKSFQLTICSKIVLVSRLKRDFEDLDFHLFPAEIERFQLRILSIGTAEYFIGSAIEKFLQVAIKKQQERWLRFEAAERSSQKQEEAKPSTSWGPLDSVPVELKADKPDIQPIICDHSNYRYDLCSLNRQTVLEPTTNTLFVSGSDNQNPKNQPTQEKIRPYPRKWEKSVMTRITELTVTSASASTPAPACKFRHSAPALIFSAGGYTGNFFHDFNDGFIPLFVTSRSISSNQDIVLVVSHCDDWWINKYAELLQQFSRHPIVNLDRATDTHCFPSATVGLISQGFMTIEPSLLPHSETFLDFRAVIGDAYRDIPVYFRRPSIGRRPRLVLAARNGGVGRVILNQAEVVQVAEAVGFEVILFEPNLYSSLSQAYGLINGSHAMLGVHGAALTHSLFLRPGSVLIQVVPIGIDWLAETCFGKSSRDMGLEYVEYKIEQEESSLIERYGKDHLVLTDPKAVVKEDWFNIKKIYLQGQDVKLDLVRIQSYLQKAYEKAKRFMAKDDY